MIQRFFNCLYVDSVQTVQNTQFRFSIKITITLFLIVFVLTYKIFFRAMTERRDFHTFVLK